MSHVEWVSHTHTRLGLNIPGSLYVSRLDTLSSVDIESLSTEQSAHAQVSRHMLMRAALDIMYRYTLPCMYILYSAHMSGQMRTCAGGQ